MRILRADSWQPRFPRIPLTTPAVCTCSAWRSWRPQILYTWSTLARSWPALAGAPRRLPPRGAAWRSPQPTRVRGGGGLLWSRVPAACPPCGGLPLTIRASARGVACRPGRLPSLVLRRTPSTRCFVQLLRQRASLLPPATRPDPAADRKAEALSCFYLVGMLSAGLGGPSVQQQELRRLLDRGWHATKLCKKWVLHCSCV